MKRNMLVMSAVAVLLMLAPAAFALHTRATVDDAVKMWSSGMTADEIVTFIEKSGVYGPLSDENIARLEEAGMPARLIVDVDRAFTRMADADTGQYAPAYRAPRPVVYGSPYPYPYYSPWRTGIGLSFGFGRGFGRGGFGHGGFGRSFGHGRGGHRGRH